MSKLIANEMYWDFFDAVSFPNAYLFRKKKHNRINKKYIPIKVPNKPKHDSTDRENTLNVVDLIIDADKGDRGSQVLLGLRYEKGNGVEKSYNEAFKYYSLAAEQGDVFCIHKIGKFYERGLGVTKCFREAFKYYKLAADQGDPMAQYSIGQFYEEGKGTKRSLESAFCYYKLSAEQGYDLAQDKVAEFYLNGIGTKKSINNALYYYRVAGMQGNGYSYLAYCELLLKLKGHEKRAINTLKYLSQRGLSYSTATMFAQHDLGQCYEKGIGVKKSLSNAFYYYQRAAKNGCLGSQMKLANAYLDGNLGVEKSYESAIFYFKLAAEQNYCPALETLGCMYEKGLWEAKKSPKKAFYYFKRSFCVSLRDQKVRKLCQLALSEYYRKGIVVQKSLKKDFWIWNIGRKVKFLGYLTLMTGIPRRRNIYEAILLHNSAKSYFS